MRAPLAFAYGNCVFATGLGDGWAAFSVETSSYTWLGEEAKRARLLELVAALEAVQADVQILRVAGRWPLIGYAGELDGDAHADDGARHDLSLIHI